MLGYLPENSEMLLMEMRWSFEDIKVVNNLTAIVRYSSKGEFLNWLIEKLLS